MAELIENPKLAGARMLQSGLQGAASLYGQLQQVKAERERLDEAKVQARYEAGMRLLTDPKLPASIKAKAYNSGVRPYIEKFSPGESLDLTEADFQGGDIQSLIDEVSPIWNSKDYSAEDKRALMSVPFAKWQSRFGLNKEAASTLMGGFGVMGEEGKKDFMAGIDALRKEYTALPQVKDFQTVSSSYQKIRAGAKQNSAAGDLSLVFAYMKLLDPGSVVREGEFANAENAAGVPDRIRAQYNKIKNGERLAQTQRRDFIETAGSLYKSQERYIKAIEDQYRTLAASRGFDPAQVLLNLRAPDEAVVIPQEESPRPPAAKNVSPTGPAQNKPSGPVKVASDDDYNALPPGATFVGPDGKLRRKP
jgi:hypothetical protein